MEWITPTDARYDERRALFDAMIDERPRLIAACETPAAVGSALDRAREDGLPVAVRSFGHAVAGQSTDDDERISAAFGARKLDRLAAIKTEYDPSTAGNQNIRPRVTA